MEQRKSRKRVFLAFGLTLTFLLFTAGVYAPHGACFDTGGEVKSLGLLWAYDTEAVVRFFESLDATQLACYGEFLQIWDMLFAALYGLFYASWIGVLFGRARWFSLLPVAAAMMLDWMENLLEIQMIHQFAQGEVVSAVFVDVGSVLNSAKWVATTLIFVVLVVGVVQKIRTWIAR